MSDKAARSMGSATIAFGLVSVPCKIYPATQEQNAITFNYLHKGCGSRLKQQYICAKDGETVGRDQMIKGHEFSKDQYVTFTADELKQLEEKSTYTIDIEEFIPFEKIDPIYLDKPYYLGPDKGGAKAYALLTEALRRSGRAAIAHYASRGKSYIVMLRPIDGGMVMQTLLYSDEVRSFKNVPLDPVEVREAEMGLALQLVDSLARPDFSPEKYKDDVKERMQLAIQQKIEGKDMTIAAPEAAPQIVDIMEALRASLGKKS